MHHDNYGTERRELRSLGPLPLHTGSGEWFYLYKPLTKYPPQEDFLTAKILYSEPIVALSRTLNSEDTNLEYSTIHSSIITEYSKLSRTILR